MNVREMFENLGVTLAQGQPCMNLINQEVMCGGDPIGHLCGNKAEVLVTLGEHGDYPMCRRCAAAVGSNEWPVGLHVIERRLGVGQTAQWRRPS